MKNNTSKIPAVLFLRLLEKGVDKNSFLEEFSIKETTFYKYIQYIKHTGFIANKEKNTYKIVPFCDCLKLNKIDTEFFVDILIFADKYLSKANFKIFKKHFKKILEYSNFETYKTIKNQYNNYLSLKNKDILYSKIEKLNKFILDNKLLNISTNDEKNLLIKPLEVIYEKNSVILKFFNKKEKTTKTLPIKFISKINAILDDEPYIENIKETIFELNDKLALSYILKENERIIDKFENKIIIANSDGNKKHLFKRLLRYDVFCKILFPKKDVDDFKIFIENSIKNISKC